MVDAQHADLQPKIPQQNQQTSPASGKHSPPHLAWLDDHPRIPIGINNAWPPMNYLDLKGQLRGIGVGFIQALNKRLGGRLEIHPGPWQEIYQAVKKRQMAALMDITPRPDRQADFNFTSPYIRIPHVIFTREDAPPVTDLPGLAGKTVGVEQGFFISGLLKRKYPRIGLREYPDTSSAIDALARHEVDAYIGNRAVASYIIRNELLTGLRATGRVSETQSLNAIGVRKDWPILRDIPQKALDDITDEERASIMTLAQEAAAGEAGHKAFLRSLSNDDRKWLQKHSPISVAVMDGWPPFNFLDSKGKPAGIGADYLKALNERLGNTLAAVPGEWKRIYDDVAQRRLDVIMDITPKPSREPLFNFTRPYLDIPHVIIARKESPFLASEEALKGKTLALERGFGNVKYFREHYPDVQLKLYANTLSALEAVSRGDADAYAGNRAVTLYLIEKNFLTNLRVHGNLNKPGSVLALGIRKDWPRLRGILQKALDDVSSQERQRILDRWVRDNNSGTASVDLTPAQQAWLSKHREIPIGVDGNWPPIDFTDEQGRHVGIAADYLRLLGQRLGVRFIPKASATFKEMLAKVTRGELKIGATVAYSTQRARGLVYTTPFFNVREVIVTRDDNKHLQRAEDLAGHTVAMEDGYITVTKIKRRYPGIRLLLVKDTLSALQKVSWSQADAYIGNQAVATWLQRANQLDNLVIAGDAGIGDDPQHFVVSRQAPDWAPLVGIMGKALASLSEEERQRISQRWLGARNITTTLPKVRLSKQEQRWLQEHKSIRLGVGRAWPPMEFIDEQGEYKGISRDYTRLFGRQLGINWVAPKALPWDDVLDGVNAHLF